MKFEPQTTLGTTFGAATPVPKFAAPDTTLRERSDFGCIMVSTAVDTGNVVTRIADALGFSLPSMPGATARMGRYVALWLTPRSWLIHCPIDDEFQLVARVNAEFGDKLVHASLFTDYLCWFELNGPRVWTLLTGGGFISLEPEGLAPGRTKRTLFAGIPVVIMRTGQEQWILGVERSRAPYFVDWLRDSASRANFNNDVHPIPARRPGSIHD